MTVMDIADLPEMQCHRTRDHVPHVVYTTPGPGDPIGNCPGLGDMTEAAEIAHPMDDDPFAGCDDEVTF
jgi:hypothetical protein